MIITRTRLGLALAVAAGVAGTYWKWSLPGESGFSASHPPAGTPPGHLFQLLKLRAGQLSGIDIALMNLLCAEGLRGSEDLDPKETIQLLDRWAGHVETETRRNYHRFLENPGEYRQSRPYFQMLMLAVVLQEDFQIAYNPDRMTRPGYYEPNEVFFRDSRDVFIHGLINGKRQGTCASLPVLYVAVGRRLGYPLKLAATRSHLFVRWEHDAGNHFNIEATGKGFLTYNDDYYKTWPFKVSEEEIKANGYLKSFTPEEELAAFLSERGHCLMSMGKTAEAVGCHDKALQLVPNSKPYRVNLAMARAEAAEMARLASAISSKKRMRTTMLPDPILQTCRDEIDLLARQAEISSRQNRPELKSLQIQPQPVGVPRPAVNQIPLHTIP